MVSAAEIREVVSSYLSHNDGDRFVLEFSPLSHNVLKNGDAEAQALANKIESKMADIPAGILSISDFKRFLYETITPPMSSIYKRHLNFSTGSLVYTNYLTPVLSWEYGASSSAPSASKQSALEYSLGQNLLHRPALQD